MQRSSVVNILIWWIWNSERKAASAPLFLSLGWKVINNESLWSESFTFSPPFFLSPCRNRPENDGTLEMGCCIVTTKYAITMKIDAPIWEVSSLLVIMVYNEQSWVDTAHNNSLIGYLAYITGYQRMAKPTRPANRLPTATLSRSGDRTQSRTVDKYH